MQRPFAFVLVIALGLVGCASGSDSTPTTATSPSTTVEIAPPTTQATTAPPTTQATTTASPTTLATTTAPPTVAVSTAAQQPAAGGDELTVAIDRAQTAIRNCYAAVPNPCDSAELSAALAGPQLDFFSQLSTSGATFEGADGLVWTIKDDPTLQSENSASAKMCRFSPMVVTTKDGTVDSEATYNLENWLLFMVDGSWKLVEVLSAGEQSPDASACDG